MIAVFVNWPHRCGAVSLDDYLNDIDVYTANVNNERDMLLMIGLYMKEYVIIESVFRRRAGFKSKRNQASIEDLVQNVMIAIKKAEVNSNINECKDKIIP